MLPASFLFERFNLLTDFDMEEFEYNGRISRNKIVIKSLKSNSLGGN